MYVRIAQTNPGTHCEVVKLAWQLRDVNLTPTAQDHDGGYICIPGSHRACRPLPDSGASFERADPMADANRELREAGHLQLLRMRAGDVCIFMAATQSHGAAAWQSETPRRCVVYGVWAQSRAPLHGSRDAVKQQLLEQQRSRM